MDWNLMGMLHAMSWTARGVVIMLLLISAVSICVAANADCDTARARHQSVMFVQQVTAVLENGKLDEAISVAERTARATLPRWWPLGSWNFKRPRLTPPARNSSKPPLAAWSVLLRLSTPN